MNEQAIKSTLLRIFRLEVEWTYATDDKEWLYRDWIDKKMEALKVSLNVAGVTYEDEPIRDGKANTIILLNGTPWLKFDMNQLDQSSLEWKKIDGSFIR